MVVGQDIQVTLQCPVGICLKRWEFALYYRILC